MNIGHGLETCVHTRAMAEREIKIFRILQLQVSETSCEPTMSFVVGRRAHLTYVGATQAESRQIARELREVLGIRTMDRKLNENTGAVTLVGEANIQDGISISVSILDVGTAPGCELVERTKHIEAHDETYFEMDCGQETTELLDVAKPLT
jgi:hypothetical protein